MFAWTWRAGAMLGRSGADSGNGSLCHGSRAGPVERSAGPVRRPQTRLQVLRRIGSGRPRVGLDADSCATTTRHTGSTWGDSNGCGGARPDRLGTLEIWFLDKAVAGTMNQAALRELSRSDELCRIRSDRAEPAHDRGRPSHEFDL